MAPSRESLGLAFLEAALQVGKGLEADSTFQVGGRVGLVRHPATAILEVGNLVEGLDNPLLLQLTKADNRAGLVMLREGGVTTYLVDLAGPLVKSFMYQAMQAGLLAPGTTFIFSSLDFPSLELDFARLSGARLLGFSLMDQEARCLSRTCFERFPNYVTYDKHLLTGRCKLARQIFAHPYRICKLGFTEASNLGRCQQSKFCGK